ncbi:MAG: hypothetical protein JXR83_03390 [Deltaproteobacteria bacterium]|nr:hypothetical protein [Deltaproteobacteria bacterium]
MSRNRSCPLTAISLVTILAGGAGCGGCTPQPVEDAAVGHDAAVGPDTAVGHDAAVGPDTAVGHDAAVGPDTAVGHDAAVGPDTAVGRDRSVTVDRQTPEGGLLALDAIPLARLCEALGSGYFRILVGYAAATAQVASPERCGGQRNDDLFDLLDFSPEALKVDCVADAPVFARALAARVAVSVNANRAQYNGTLAMQCLRDGRLFIDERGGLINVASSRFDAGVGDAAGYIVGCDGWLVGLVAPNGSCEEHWECGAGYFCKRTASGCTGTCVQPVATDQSCDLFDRCDNGSCVNGVCVETPDLPPAGVDQACGYLDAGQVVCADGLYCDDGHCRPLPVDGQPCTESEECASSLTCGPGTYDGGVCAAPRANGQECTGFRGACEPCSPCTGDSPDSAVPSHCRSYRAAGQSCGANIGPCLLGNTCINGLCRAPAYRGQPCVIDHSLEGVGGNCMAAGDYCQDDDRDGVGECALRGDEGAACTAPALATSVQGSCAGSYLYCKRAAASATSGICTRRPAQGEACGDRYDLSKECTVPDPDTPVYFNAGPMCSASGEGQVGVCRTYEGGLLAGDPCSWTYQCPTGHYCSTTSHTCLVGAGLYQPCSDTDSVCADGRCEYRDDAGYQMICVPYLGLGATCTSAYDDDCGPDRRCVEVTAGRYQCAAKAAAGESCGSDDDCAGGNRCSNGVCAVGVCARDSCQNCSQNSGLTLMLFFSMVVLGNPLKRWRRRASR